MIKWSDRWPDFKIEEVLSPIQLKMVQEKKQFPYPFEALDTLQEFRNFIGMPFLINHGELQRRGARSMQEAYDINLATRGKQNPARAWEYSFHLWCAFDISVNGMTSKELFLKALVFGKFGGVGLYDTFVHCDCRVGKILKMGDDYVFTGEKETWDARAKI